MYIEVVFILKVHLGEISLPNRKLETIILNIFKFNYKLYKYRRHVNNIFISEGLLVLPISPLQAEEMKR